MASAEGISDSGILNHGQKSGHYGQGGTSRTHIPRASSASSSSGIVKWRPQPSRRSISSSRASALRCLRIRQVLRGEGPQAGSPRTLYEDEQLRQGDIHRSYLHTARRLPMLFTGTKPDCLPSLPMVSNTPRWVKRAASCLVRALDTIRSR